MAYKYIQLKAKSNVDKENVKQPQYMYPQYAYPTVVTTTEDQAQQYWRNGALYPELEKENPKF